VMCLYEYCVWVLWISTVCLSSAVYDLCVLCVRTVCGYCGLVLFDCLMLALKNLRTLNLNSTKLSALAFERLKVRCVDVCST